MRRILSILIGVFAIVPPFCETLNSQINQYFPRLSCTLYSGSGCTLYDGLSPVESADAAEKRQKKEKNTPKKLYTLLRIGLYTISRIRLYTLLRNIQ